jgi:hypothetical protein
LVRESPQSARRRGIDPCGRWHKSRKDINREAATPDTVWVTRTLSEAARDDCIEHVNRSLRRSALLGIPASTILALVLGANVALSTRVVFVALVSTADVFTFATSSCPPGRRSPVSRGLRCQC